MEILIVLLSVVLPMALAYQIATKRNRSKIKSILVVLFFGWIGLLFLAIGLKTRDPQTGFLK